MSVPEKPECSVHTHSVLCDGKDTLAAMAAAAFAAGVSCFGASGHSHTPIPLDEGYVLPADLSGYCAEVLRLREAYAGRMEVLLGIEQDACADAPVPADFDYWIGSVHFLHDEEEARYVPVDWSPEELARCCVEWFRGDFSALVRRYYTDVAAMAARRPTILGHLDLIAKFNEGGAVFDEDDRRYRAAALAALHAADPAVTLLEINTGAMARGYRTVPYPALFLLQEWRRMGGSVILTTDAHSASAVVYGYREAAALARAAGYGERAVLTRSGRALRPL